MSSEIHVGGFWPQAFPPPSLKLTCGAFSNQTSFYVLFTAPPGGLGYARGVHFCHVGIFVIPDLGVLYGGYTERCSPSWVRSLETELGIWQLAAQRSPSMLC